MVPILVEYSYKKLFLSSSSELANLIGVFFAIGNA